MASANFPNRPFRLEENVWLISQDVANNRSRVGGQLWIRKNSYSPTWTSSTTSGYEFWINGGRVSNGNFSYDFRNSDELLLAQGEWWVPHNADGTKTMAIAGYADVETLGYTQVETSIGLPKIARASTPTFPNGSSFDAGTTVQINTNRASTAFTHSANWYFGTANGLIAEGITTSTNWVPPLTMLQQIPDATSGTGHIRLYTWNGSTLVGYRDLGFTLKAGAAIKPSTPTTTIADQNATVVSVVGALVQNLSNIKVTSAANGIQGSTIQSITNTVNGVSVSNGGTTLITKSGTNAVIATATDSRGRTSTKTTNISALAYSNPTITQFTAKRTTSAGVESDTGTYLRFDLKATVSSLLNGTERNGINLVVRTRPTNGAWTTRNTINTGLTYDSGALITGGSVFPITSSFDVQVTLTDKVGRTFVAQTTVATASFTLDLNGKNVGVGKVHERGVLDVGGEIYSTENIRADFDLRAGRHLYVSQNFALTGTMTSGTVPVARLVDLSNGLSITTSPPQITDADLASSPGFYTLTSSGANSPIPGQEVSIQVIGNSTRQTQIATRTTGLDRTYKRWRAGSPLAWSTWYEINDERESTWINATLASGWSGYGGETAQYKRTDGVLYLNGRILGTAAAGTTMFTLPAGYRPDATYPPIYTTHSDNGPTIIGIEPSTGVVTIHSRAGASRSGVSLAGIVLPVA